MISRWSTGSLALALGLAVAGAPNAAPQMPEPTQPREPPRRHPVPEPGSASPDERPEPEPTLEAGERLVLARDALRAKDLAAAADHVEEATTIVRQEAEGLGRVERDQLDAAAFRLDRLAQQLRAGEPRRPRAVDRELAHAAHALAARQHHRAKQAWIRDEPRRAGAHLAAAARHLAHAAEWTGREVTRGTREAIGGAIQISTKLTAGVGFAPEEVARALDGVGRAIDRVGTELRGKRGARPAGSRGSRPAPSNPRSEP